MNRVTNGAQSEGQRSPEPPSPRRSRDDLGDRYQPGRRRTAGEPLSASWRPAPGQLEQTAAQARQARRERNPVRRITKAYGWRVYALPILVVITALVVFNTARGPAEPAGGSASIGTDSSSGTGSDLSEKPALPANLNVPTAPLPDGGAFTQSGRMSWHVVPLAADGTSGKRAGTTGRLYHYTVEVEDGIDPSSYAGDDSFARTVEATLSDTRSWVGTGKVSLQRVDASFPNPDFRVRLTTPDTATRADLCGFGIPYPTSCYIRGFQRSVIINLSRWVRGALAFGADMGTYRQYAVNHEVGHALGKSHVGCQANGALAPVMMQQTFGVSNDYVAQLNQVDIYNSKAVPSDGKVCRPNAWPVLDLGDSAPTG
ncbi:DUF3152 domain-containing protein [Amycolatopsis acidiphila]|uniref:DUF3152 domain-containing protein n=1 Tax=Amycolatopsis acidiphila TaxID=715473 RepID=A0A557ZW03_9PSEU|nr:DUF3152 domain-containing protein [Amycolatopsis acidiphila]TVT16197.1 DUF3152 domain-containing protein [Amycolatopsis acidiphila]UIJ60990.1 DUF3152 domain-containing protein [Amycolatopsis acidiphila]